MVVRIRFGSGPVVSRRKGKNSRIAVLSASFFTLISICLLSLGIWRVLQDFDLANNFIYSDGLLSHWQVWIAGAALVQYLGWRLTRYAKTAPRQDVEPRSPQTEKDTPSSVAANV